MSKRGDHIELSTSNIPTFTVLWFLGIIKPFQQQHGACISKAMLRPPTKMATVHSRHYRWGGEVVCARLGFFIATLWSLTLQGYSEVGHCSEKWGTAGNLWGISGWTGGETLNPIYPLRVVSIFFSIIPYITLYFE